LAAVRQPLKLSAYRRLLGAYALNELAWSIGSLALAVLVYHRTGSAIGAAAFFLCSQFVPALASPALVAQLDSLAPRGILPALYALEGLLFLALAGVAHSFALAPVLVLTVLDGVVALAGRSLARAATVTVLDQGGLLREGNALTNSVFSVCLMGGPAIGGVVVAANGTTAALLANSALFGLIALTLLSSSSLPAASSQSRGGARLRAAVRYVRGQPGIRSLIGLQAVGAVFFTMSIPVEVVFAQQTLHAGPRGYGGLLSAWGAGAVAGSLVYGRWRRLPSRALIAIGAGALGTGLAVMAAAPGIVIALIGSALAGSGNGVEAVATRTAVQEQVDSEWMALVTSLHESISQAAPGIGIALGGALTALASPRVALGVAAAGALVITALVRVVLRPSVLEETLA
jgi:predicted MFS family arabinose efflux permease